MAQMKELLKQLKRLEKVRDAAWNDRATVEQLTEALEEAIGLIQDQLSLYASITSAAARPFDPEDRHKIVRALVCEDPGTGPRLLLERVVLGAEDLPLTIDQQVEVQQPGRNSLGGLRFEGSQLHFVTDPDDDARAFTVEATLKKLGTKATRVR